MMSPHYKNRWLMFTMMMYVMTFQQILQKCYLVTLSFLVQQTMNYPSPYLNHIMATKMLHHMNKTLLLMPTPRISHTNGKHKKKCSFIVLKTSSPAKKSFTCAWSCNSNLF